MNLATVRMNMLYAALRLQNGGCRVTINLDVTTALALVSAVQRALHSPAMDPITHKVARNMIEGLVDKLADIEPDFGKALRMGFDDPEKVV